MAAWQNTSTRLAPAVLLALLFFSWGVEAKKAKAPRAAAEFEMPRAPKTAAEVMGSMTTQGILSEASHVEAPAPKDTTAAPDGDGDGDGDGGGGRDGFAEAEAQRAESAKFQDEVEKELESDMGKNTASLAGAINMDGGEMGSIGGIPDGEDDSNPWGEHEISDLHHAVAFGIALVMCLIFSAWVASAFFELKQDAGWANLPRVVLTDNARKLINSVDKEFKA